MLAKTPPIGRRQAWLESRGLRVIRIFNIDVVEKREGVMEQIDRECQARIVARAEGRSRGE